MNCCVCYCIDNNDFNNKLLYCSLYSLRKYNSVDVVIMTFSDNPFRSYYQKFSNVEVYDIDPVYQNLFEKIPHSSYYNEKGKKMVFRKDISNMSYFRLEIPILLSEYDRVLYLDTDTEIKRDLSPLFEMDFGENEIIGQYNREPHLEECIRNLSDYDIHIFDEYLSCKKDYICSGVLLFNNSKINESNYSERLQTILDFENRYYDIHLWKDEFLINMSFHCQSSRLLDCEDVAEYQTTKSLDTNSYIVHYIWKYKKNLIHKYQDVLKKEGLL